LDIVTIISRRDWRLIRKLSKIHFVSIVKFYPEQSSPISKRAKTTTSHCPNLAALTDLSHLSSHKNEGEKSKAQCDQEVTKELKLKRWDG